MTLLSFSEKFWYLWSFAVGFIEKSFVLKGDDLKKGAKNELSALVKMVNFSGFFGKNA